MSITDELRRLLDERGVEWSDDGYATTCTVWVASGIVWHGLWRDDCIELIAHLTPEQAIAATLGMGINCSKAEHDAGGCLGFQSGDDDEPVEQCKACHRYTSWEVEL